MPTDPLSPAAVAVLGLIEPRQALAAPPLPRIAAAVQALALDQAQRLFCFASPRDDKGLRPVGDYRDRGGLGEGTLALVLSPQRRRRALCWHDARQDTVQLWIDGRGIALPGAAAGWAGAEPTGDWFDDDVFAIGTLVESHPQQDFSRRLGRGSLQGLLICDALGGREIRVDPAPDEVWSWPTLQVDGDVAVVFADPEARARGEVARRVPLPRG